MNTNTANTNTANTNTGCWAVRLRWDQGLQKLYYITTSALKRTWKLICRCWGEMSSRGALSSILILHSDLVRNISNEFQSTQDQRCCNERCIIPCQEIFFSSQRNKILSFATALRRSNLLGFATLRLNLSAKNKWNATKMCCSAKSDLVRGGRWQ